MPNENETVLPAEEIAVASEEVTPTVEEVAELAPEVQSEPEVQPEVAPKDVTVEDPNSDGYNTPSEVRIKELDAEVQPTPDFSKGCQVWNGESLVTTFTKEADGDKFVEKAKLFAEAHGYQVK